MLDLNSTVHANLSVLQELSAVLIPGAVALLTKSNASRGLKGVLNALLAVLAGVVYTATKNNGSIVLAEAVKLSIDTFVISIVTYYGLYKSTGLSDKIAGATAKVGIGGSA